MIINGVTLPDIPADVLETYPYLTCLMIPAEGAYHTMLLVSTQKTAFFPITVDPYDGIVIISDIDGTAIAYGLSSDATEWVTDGEPVTDVMSFFLSTFGLTDNSAFYPNHDIYIATDVDTATGKYTVGTEVWKTAVEYKFDEEEPKPLRVSIGRSLVDGFATQVQRLTGTTEQMNAVQIRDKLSTVKAGIKIGDVVLPAIPEDVLAEYPNAVIYKETTTDNSIRYALCVSATPMLLLPKAIAQQVAGKNIDIMYNSYAYRAFYENEAWGDLTAFNNGYVEYEGQMGVAVGEFNGYLYEFIYTNHDIYEVTSVDTSTGQYVLGDIYFSERQNFNGVWLPKIPDDFFGEKPYGFLFRLNYNGENQYFLVKSHGEFLFLPEDVFGQIGLDPSILDGAEGFVTSEIEEPLSTLYCSSESTNWMTGNDQENAVPIGQFGETYYYELLWANHDIYAVASVDMNGGGFIPGDLYFPPLPAIDTDRVSIGYDLFDSIVQDVQRLSGETEKMNALRAYWKLTTVEVL